AVRAWVEESVRSATVRMDCILGARKRCACPRAPLLRCLRVCPCCRGCAAGFFQPTRVSMAIYQLGDRIPRVDPSAFIYENATIIGAVEIGRDVNIWASAVIRGDNEPIVIGDGSNVQECCVLHTDPGYPL